VRLEPLYRVEWSYPEHYDAGGPDGVGLFFAEGRCEGRLSGRVRALNRARRRSDGVWLPHVHGVIETGDGASVAFELRGYGRPRGGALEPVAALFHQTGDGRYAHLNDAVCVAAGEARDRLVALDVAQVVWEPPG
jgi:hypothetical protein